MTNSIDVREIAEKIFREIESKSEEEFDLLLQELKSAESQTHEHAMLFHGILNISKKHSERFAVALIQKVVDELKASDEH